MSIRRLLIIAAICAALYYGYTYYMSFAEEYGDVRGKVGEEKKDEPQETVDPVSSTAQRRRAEEQAVNAARSKPSK